MFAKIVFLKTYDTPYNRTCHLRRDPVSEVLPLKYYQEQQLIRLVKIRECIDYVVLFFSECLNY